MKTVEIKLTMDIADNFEDELSKIIDHHIEYLIDLDKYNDEILSVYGAEMKRVIVDESRYRMLDFPLGGDLERAVTMLQQYSKENNGKKAYIDFRRAQS